MIYEIAGLKVDMNPIHERMRKQSESYLSSGNPVIHVHSNPMDEIRILTEDPNEGDLEYICYSADFCRKIVDHGRFFIHASAVVYQGEAYLFSAPSGTGKSTHTSFWNQVLPDTYILNDDKPVLQPCKDGITVWGTPFAGKTDLHVNTHVPLKGICFLKQGSENRIRKLNEEEGLALLLNNTWRPSDINTMNTLLDMMEQVVSKTGIYEMSCTESEEAALLSFHTMRGE